MTRKKATILIMDTCNLFDDLGVSFIGAINLVYWLYEHGYEITPKTEEIK